MQICEVLENFTTYRKRDVNNDMNGDMNINMNTDNELRMRPYKNCDAATIINWITDEVSFRKWSADRYDHYPIEASDINDMYMKEIDSDSFFPMTAYDDSGVVGHMIMRFLDEEKKDLRFGFIIVDTSKRGKGYGKKMIMLAKKFAFEILKVDRVSLGVFDNNDAAKHCYAAAGLTANGETNMFNLMGEEWMCIELEAHRKKEQNENINYK